jgi:hypothetical protein
MIFKKEILENYWGGGAAGGAAAPPPCYGPAMMLQEISWVTTCIENCR